MLLIVERDYDKMSRKGAEIVASAIRSTRPLVLGLASGATPLGMYRELVRLHRDEGLDFSRVVAFNLDEFLDLGHTDAETFSAYLWKNFLGRINIEREGVRLLDSAIGADHTAYCEQYEARIRTAGGIDLQILGIGENGHIAFNEPGSSFTSRTHVRSVCDRVLENDPPLFSGHEGDRPQNAITMGIGTILEAKQILLLASGAAKANAIATAIEGPVTDSVPASALQLHPQVTAMLDRDSARKLTNKSGPHHAPC